MKIKNAVARLNRRCSCTSCTFKNESQRSSVKKNMLHGSFVDKRFLETFMPLRERKLLEKLVKSRAYNDFILMLAEGKATNNTVADSKSGGILRLSEIELDTSNRQCLDALKINDDVKLGSIKLTECCSFGSTIPLHEKDLGEHRHRVCKSSSSVVPGNKAKAREKRRKPKHVVSDVCTCLSDDNYDWIKHNSKTHKIKSHGRKLRPAAFDYPFKTFDENQTSFIIPDTKARQAGMGETINSAYKVRAGSFRSSAKVGEKHGIVITKSVANLNVFHQPSFKLVVVPRKPTGKKIKVKTIDAGSIIKVESTEKEVQIDAFSVPQIETVVKLNPLDNSCGQTLKNVSNQCDGFALRRCLCSHKIKLLDSNLDPRAASNIVKKKNKSATPILPSKSFTARPNTCKNHTCRHFAKMRYKVTNKTVQTNLKKKSCLNSNLLKSIEKTPVNEDNIIAEKLINNLTGPCVKKPSQTICHDTSMYSLDKHSLRSCCSMIKLNISNSKDTVLPKSLCKAAASKSKTKVINKSTTMNECRNKKVECSFYKKKSLLPYECEPGNCVPDECNPQDCLDIIYNKHNQKNKIKDKTTLQQCVPRVSVPDENNLHKYYKLIKDGEKNNFCAKTGVINNHYAQAKVKTLNKYTLHSLDFERKTQTCGIDKSDCYGMSQNICNKKIKVPFKACPFKHKYEYYGTCQDKSNNTVRYKTCNCGFDKCKYRKNSPHIKNKKNKNEPEFGLVPIEYFSHDHQLKQFHMGDKKGCHLTRHKKIQVKNKCTIFPYKCELDDYVTGLKLVKREQNKLRRTYSKNLKTRQSQTNSTTTKLKTVTIQCSLRRIFKKKFAHNPKQAVRVSTCCRFDIEYLKQNTHFVHNPVIYQYRTPKLPWLQTTKKIHDVQSQLRQSLRIRSNNNIQNNVMFQSYNKQNGFSSLHKMGITRKITHLTKVDAPVKEKYPRKDMTSKSIKVKSFNRHTVLRRDHHTNNFLFDISRNISTPNLPKMFKEVEAQSNRTRDLLIFSSSIGLNIKHSDFFKIQSYHKHAVMPFLVHDLKQNTEELSWLHNFRSKWPINFQRSACSFDPIIDATCSNSYDFSNSTKHNEFQNCRRNCKKRYYKSSFYAFRIQVQNAKGKYKTCKLKPYKCEPKTCFPTKKESKNIESEQSISKRDMNLKGSGKRSSSTSASTDNRNQPISSTSSEKEVSEKEREKRNLSKKASVMPKVKRRFRVRNFPPKKASVKKQGIRIGSTFCFNIEFSKNAHTKEQRKQTQKINKRNGLAYDTNEIKKYRSIAESTNTLPDYASIGTGKDDKQLCHAETNCDVIKQHAGINTVPDRCFCTLKLLKMGKTHADKAVGCRTKKFVQQPKVFKDAGQNARLESKYDNMEDNKKKRHKRGHFSELEPYECEPGICIPGECDPYKCLEIIKRRATGNRSIGSHVKPNYMTKSTITKESKMPPKTTPAQKIDLITSRPAHFKEEVKPIQVKDYRGPPKALQETVPMKRRPANYKEKSAKLPASIKNDPSSKKVTRIGSTFSFTLEFFKQNANREKESIGPAFGTRVRKAIRPVGLDLAGEGNGVPSVAPPCPPIACRETKSMGVGRDYKNIGLQYTRKRYQNSQGEKGTMPRKVLKRCYGTAKCCDKLAAQNSKHNSLYKKITTRIHDLFSPKKKLPRKAYSNQCMQTKAKNLTDATKMADLRLNNKTIQTLLNRKPLICNPNASGLCEICDVIYCKRTKQMTKATGIDQEHVRHSQASEVDHKYELNRCFCKLSLQKKPMNGKQAHNKFASNASIGNNNLPTNPKRYAQGQKIISNNKDISSNKQNIITYHLKVPNPDSVILYPSSFKGLKTHGPYPDCKLDDWFQKLNLKLAKSLTKKLSTAFTSYEKLENQLHKRINFENNKLFLNAGKSYPRLISGEKGPHTGLNQPCKIILPYRPRKFRTKSLNNLNKEIFVSADKYLTEKYPYNVKPKLKHAKKVAKKKSKMVISHNPEKREKKYKCTQIANTHETSKQSKSGCIKLVNKRNELIKSVHDNNKLNHENNECKPLGAFGKYHLCYPTCVHEERKKKSIANTITSVYHEYPFCGQLLQGERNIVLKRCIRTISLQKALKEKRSLVELSYNTEDEAIGNITRVPISSNNNNIVTYHFKLHNTRNTEFHPLSNFENQETNDPISGPDELFVKENDKLVKTINKKHSEITALAIKLKLKKYLHKPKNKFTENTTSVAQKSFSRLSSGDTGPYKLVGLNHPPKIILPDRPSKFKETCNNLLDKFSEVISHTDKYFIAKRPPYVKAALAKKLATTKSKTKFKLMLESRNDLLTQIIQVQKKTKQKSHVHKVCTNVSPNNQKQKRDSDQSQTLPKETLLRRLSDFYSRTKKSLSKKVHSLAHAGFSANPKNMDTVSPVRSKN